MQSLTASQQNSRRMGQAEMLYVNLISVSESGWWPIISLNKSKVAQWHGLLSSNGDRSIVEDLGIIIDDEKKWQAWSKIECVKR